jgi:monoterpene epsilon-lactone hydrolase
MSDGALTLGPRVIPVPTSISPQAQAFLVQAASVPGRRSHPAADDKAGWRRFVEDSNHDLILRYRARSASFVGSTERIRIGQVEAYISEPAELETPRSIYLDVHGGAFIIGHGEACKLTGMMVAARLGIEVYSVDYRMPPDHPFPAGLDDCVAAYRALLEFHPPTRIVVGGASAGGGLAAALMLRARDEGLPLPAALVLRTPEVDLTESGDTFEVLADIDVVLPRRLTDSIRIYAGNQDLSNPYLSPLFGDFTQGFPPTFLQSGTRDLFLSNTVRFHRALRRANIPVELHIFEAMPHGGFFSGAPEEDEMWDEVRRFTHGALAQAGSGK